MMRYLYAFLTAAGLTLFVIAPPSLAQAAPTQLSDTPAFSSIPELDSGFHDLYIQKFPEARELFEKWAKDHPSEPFGQVAIAASYLFEEFYLQHVLTSDYFLNDKRFLGGITGTPDSVRIRGFQSGISKARALAFQRLKRNSRDPEGLYALTLAAGMESDAYSMLLKKHYDALKRLKEANVNAELLLQQRPDAHDAYVALGSANYIIGSLPGSARFMLWFGGIHGDKRLGMEQLQKTVDGGRYLKPFAQILLALSARREKQDALAQKLLKDLTEEFPGNPLYQAEYEKALGRPIPASIGPAQ
jgi:tetratricopeptide (TPR) repeat protein